MKFNRDMPVTWQGVVLFVSLFVAFVAGGLLVSTFAPDAPAGHVLSTQAGSAATLVVCLVRGGRLLPGDQAHARPGRRSGHGGGDARGGGGAGVVYGPAILLVGLLMTWANYANTRPGGTFRVPVGLIFLGVAATVAGVVESPVRGNGRDGIKREAGAGFT